MKATNAFRPAISFRRSGDFPVISRGLFACLTVGLGLVVALPVRAQTVAPSSSARPSEEEAPVELSPFEVRASSDVGYAATETLGGSRLNTQLKDVATQVNVMTREFLDDLAVTTLDDAMTYSLNTENRFESIDVSSTSYGSSESVSVVESGQGGRTRGLSAPNNSHDFFDTFTRTDSYNTERFTFASGPNSILFGNSSPSGTIDTTFKRARTDRRSLELSNRASSTGSLRYTADFNQPLWKDRVALRVSLLRDRDESWRKPAFSDQDRAYATLTIRPFRAVTFRAYAETGTFKQQAVKNTLLRDHVTPWIAAGKPLYNNALGQTLLSSTTTPPIDPSLRRPNAPVRAVVMFDGSGFLGNPVNTQTNMALTSGYPDLAAVPDNFERSIVDESIYPYDRSFHGNASQAKYHSWIRGAALEINPFKNLFVEAAYNEEEIRNRGVEFMDARAQIMYVDPNLYLNDRVTPNPKVGQYYVEDTVGGVNNTAAKEFGTKKQGRVSLSYELNFEQRKSWLKWLGLHRLAFLYDQLESKRVREVSILTVTPRTSGSYAFVTSNANSTQIGFRYYIDPAKGDWTVNLPFDPNHDGPITDPAWRDTNGKQVVLTSFDPDATVNTPSLARNRVASTAFVTQSYFLDRRLVLGYARRRDAVDIYSELNKPANWNFDELVDSINWTNIKNEVPINTIKSAVAHPFSWLSLAYSETTSQQVRTEVVRNLDGSIAPLGSGTGRDYGVTLRWKNWLSLRVNKYENRGIGNQSSFNNATPTASETSFGPNLRQTVAALERGIQVLAPDYDPSNTQIAPASTLSSRFAYYQNDLAFNTNPLDTIGSTISNRYAVTSDSIADGYELTLTANPTSNWRIAVSGAKNSASESNIGGQYWDFIQERIPVWGAPGNLDNFVPSTTRTGVSTNYRTYRQVLAVAAQNWYYIKQSEGALNNNIRKYRFTATTRYSFTRGRLKGAFAGGNYVWRSAAAVGYPYISVSDNPFLVPGVAGSTISVVDIGRPYRAGALTSFDAFLGYNRRIWNNKVRWQCQLNIRNVLDNDGLLVQKTLSTGDGAVFTPQEPRSFILTNTFSF